MTALIIIGVFILIVYILALAFSTKENRKNWFKLEGDAVCPELGDDYWDEEKFTQSKKVYVIQSTCMLKKEDQEMLRNKIIEQLKEGVLLLDAFLEFKGVYILPLDGLPIDIKIVTPEAAKDA